MKTYIVNTDIHRFSSYPLPLVIDKESIDIGDIYDVAGCLRKDLDHVRLQMAAHKATKGVKYCMGNHELEMDSLKDQYIENGILFTHGHLELWGLKKCMKYLKKRPGKTKFMRWVSKGFDSFRLLKPFHLSKRKMRRIWERCEEFDCHTYVCGHKHPTKVERVIFTHKGVTKRIVVLPRGRNIITL